MEYGPTSVCIGKEEVTFDDEARFAATRRAIVSATESVSEEDVTCERSWQQNFFRLNFTGSNERPLRAGRNPIPRFSSAHGPTVRSPPRARAHTQTTLESRTASVADRTGGGVQDRDGRRSSAQDAVWEDPAGHDAENCQWERL
jgi:hypothetical protein